MKNIWREDLPIFSAWGAEDEPLFKDCMKLIDDVQDAIQTIEKEVRPISAKRSREILEEEDLEAKWALMKETALGFGILVLSTKDRKARHGILLVVDKLDAINAHYPPEWTERLYV